MSLLGYCPVRCRDCGHRYQEGIVWLPGMGYAKCPRCLREDLADWEERYYYPPRWQQALLRVGAKAHRCGACRLNFVSFRPRKLEFMPSWRKKQIDSAELARAASAEKLAAASEIEAAKGKAKTVA